MVRPEKRIHPARTPAVPRPAATILLLRDGARGLEVLMTRRAAQASFAPGAYVFPGGAVDEADGSARAADLTLGRAGQSDEVRRFGVAAIREAFEELGLLLARHADGQWVSAATMQSLSRDPAADFLAQVADAGLRLALDEVHWYAHWITDPDLPKRFDARFFVARVPPGQDPVADNREQFEPVWISPADALKRHAAGEFPMIFPTVRTLQRMARSADVASLLATCPVDAPLWASRPRGALRRGVVERFWEEDSPYGEIELTSPDGQMLHHLDWQSEQPVRLLQHVARLTAPNPGRMTGPGTNTYLIGDDASGFIVVDPGPPIDEHIDRIAAIVGDRLQMMICTHSHPDHSPGAFLLQKRIDVPIFGLPSADTAAEHSFFRPDETLVDGQLIRAAGVTIEVVFTPGHAANHACLFLQEDRLLFSGDHILNGSTTVVNPPDGNMVDYLASLDRLEALQASFILPAHGHVIGSPQAAIRHLIRHRLGREAKVLAAVGAMPGAGLPALVTRAYDDTPHELHGIAQRSLLAHVEKLVAEGRVTASGDGWAVAGPA